MDRDMLVKLYEIDVDEVRQLEKKLNDKDVYIKKVLASDMSKVHRFVLENFRESWADETLKAVINNKCYIAVRNNEILGFACYDVSMLNIFGPIGVLESQRKLGIGKLLLLKSLLSMKELGYAYAIIGWAGPQEFYARSCGAMPIENSIPGSFENKIKVTHDKNKGLIIM